MKLSPFKLERYFALYEFTTEFLLCSSDCESLTIAELLDMEDGARERFHQVWLGYTESMGGPALRREICVLYSTMQPEDILVHAGAEEAIFLFALAALEAGDHVIVHAPAYQSLAEVARGMGCEVSAWIAREENGWNLEPGELTRLLRPSTKAIFINTPHNPTGNLMDRRDYEAVHEFAIQHNLLLFSDEVYRELEFDPAARLPAACDIGSHAVSLGVMSKSYGLAGLRIGWIATQNKEIRGRIAGLKDYTTICNSAPSEFLAELALRNRHRLLERNLYIIRHNMSEMQDFFARHRDLFTWVPPQAGTMAFPRYLGGDVSEFCDKVVRETGVLLLPGTVYDDSGNHFRLGLGRRNLPQAVKRLEQFIQ